MKKAIGFVALLHLLLPALVFAQGPPVTVVEGDNPRPHPPPAQQSALVAVADHLELGTRGTSFLLTTAKKNTFLGSIDELSAEQNYLPGKLFVTWMFDGHWGFELTFDSFAAETRTSANDNHSDGSVHASGPILTGFWRYPNNSVFTPYVGAGVACFLTDFKEETWYALGYSSPSSWESVGSPHTVRNEIRRSIETESAIGLVLTVGSTVRINDRWSADVLLRFIDADVDATVHETKGGATLPPIDGSFTLNTLSFGLGVNYRFSTDTHRL